MAYLTLGTEGAGGPREDQRGAEDCHVHPSCHWTHALWKWARWWAGWERSRSQRWVAVRGHHQGPQRGGAHHWGREEREGPETLEGNKLAAECVCVGAASTFLSISCSWKVLLLFKKWGEKQGREMTVLPDSCLALSREADLVSWHLTSILLEAVKYFEVVPESSICQM